MTAVDRAAEQGGQPESSADVISGHMPLHPDIRITVSEQFMAAADRLVPLYRLAEEFDRLVGLLEDPEQDEAAIDAELDVVAADIKAKGYGIAVVIQAIENKAVVLKAEEQRLYAKRKAAESAAERLKAYTLAQLKVIGIDRLDYGTFTLSVRLNAPSCVVLEELMVPAQFKKTVVTTTVDKNAIKDHIKATGEVVPGIELVRTESLSIR